MDRDQPRLGRHLGPVADAADVARVAQRHGRQAVLAALVDADADGLRRHGLAEAVLAVDHGDHRRVDHDLDGDVGHHGAVLLLGGIARHAHDAVAVVAGEVGAHEVAADAAALLRRAAGRGKDVRDEGLERLRLDGDRHFTLRFPPHVIPGARPVQVRRGHEHDAVALDVRAPPLSGTSPALRAGRNYLLALSSPSSRRPRAAGRRRSRGSRSG